MLRPLFIQFLSGFYSHTYTYEVNGNLSTRAESDGGANNFFYDGADQLVGELRTGPVPFSKGYTYDANGNRLTQTVNGTLTQQFTYNGHDVLASGLGETPAWDLNGNLTGDTLNGQTTTYTWDDEDRLLSQTLGGHTDTYSYTGLGMRLRKSDPSGSYWYLCDGVSPASPVLTDGHTSFTPGLSEFKGDGTGSRFYLPDAQGNSRGLLDGGQSVTDGYNWDAFGNSVSRLGSNPTAFAWNEASGYQSDGDGGLTLLGHRYYDRRTGRFISQDPAGDGDNWYAYCGNDPMGGSDPEGLWVPTPAGYGDPLGSFASGIAYANQAANMDLWLTCYQRSVVTYGQAGSPNSGVFSDTGWVAQWSIPLYSNDTGMGAGGMMIAQSVATPPGAAAVADLGPETAETLGTPKNPFPTYEGARKEALDWLEKRGFRAIQRNMRKFPRDGKANGMKSADGKMRFRVEYDEKSGAHINVENGKEIGPHISFKGTAELVEKIIARFNH